MLIFRRPTVLSQLAAAANHSHRAAVAHAGREVLAVLLDPRAAIGLGLSGQLAFVVTVLAMSERWLSVSAGLTIVALALGAYGSSLLLGHVSGLRAQGGGAPR